MLEAGRRYSDAPTAGVSLGPVDTAVLARLVSDGFARYDATTVSVAGEAVAPGGFHDAGDLPVVGERHGLVGGRAVVDADDDAWGEAPLLEGLGSVLLHAEVAVLPAEGRRLALVAQVAQVLDRGEVLHAAGHDAVDLCDHVHGLRNVVPVAPGTGRGAAGRPAEVVAGRGVRDAVAVDADEALSVDGVRNGDGRVSVAEGGEVGHSGRPPCRCSRVALYASFSSIRYCRSIPHAPARSATRRTMSASSTPKPSGLLPRAGS